MPDASRNPTLSVDSGGCNANRMLLERAHMHESRSRSDRGCFQEPDVIKLAAMDLCWQATPHAFSRNYNFCKVPDLPDVGRKGRAGRAGDTRDAPDAGDARDSRILEFLGFLYVAVAMARLF